MSRETAKSRDKRLRGMCISLVEKMVKPTRSGQADFDIGSNGNDTIKSLIDSRGYDTNRDYSLEYELYQKQVKGIREVIKDLSSNHGNKRPWIVRYAVFQIAYQNIVWNRFHSPRGKKLPAMHQVLRDIGLPKNTWYSWCLDPQRTYEILCADYSTWFLGYMGAKNNEKGFMLNWVSQFAYMETGETYSAFVDLFGGGGTATKNIIKNKRVRYFINEKEPSNVIFYKGMKDGRVVQRVGTELIRIQEIACRLYENDKDIPDVKGYLTKEYERIEAKEESNNDVFHCTLAYVYRHIFYSQRIYEDKAGITKYGVNTKNVMRFLKSNIREELAKVHDTFKQVHKVYNKDAVNELQDILDDVSSLVKRGISRRPNVLIYADPPYAGTAGYNEEGFDMKTLISSLASQPYHFILSARANYGMSDSTRAEYYWSGLFDDYDRSRNSNSELRNIVNNNQAIIDNLYEPLKTLETDRPKREKGYRLYVLICFPIRKHTSEEEEHDIYLFDDYVAKYGEALTLKKCIGMLIPLEIMITDYPVNTPPDYTDINGHKYMFATMDFDKLYELVVKEKCYRVFTADGD